MTRLRAAAALLALCAAAARADIPPALVERQPAQLARDAFDAAYGRLLVAELGRILRASADPACLRKRKIAEEELEARGHELLVRNGTRMLQRVAELIDGGKLEAIFNAHVGDDAARELALLREDPDVRRYIQLNDPARLARVADNITDTVDRHAALAGLALAKRISPRASGDAALLRANPRERSVAEAERFFKRRGSPRLKRWIELQDALQAAFKEALDHEAMAKLGPDKMTPGAAKDFARLCVARR